MSTSTSQQQQSDSLRTAPSATTGPIVVATDGTPQSEGALVTARALAGRLGADAQVLAVHPSLALIVPDGHLLVDPNVTASLRADLTRRVREQCARCSGGEAGPALVDPEVQSGEPARVIARVAAERRAQLLVVGLGRHEIADRIFGDETALKVARWSHVPVLAVPADRRIVPEYAVVGIDFSGPSMRAARAVLRLLPDGGLVRLVHVVPPERLLLDAWLSLEEYRRFVEQRFARLIDRLAIPPGITVEEVTRMGDPARELLALAAETGADLIAAGSHGHGFIARVVVGSVTTKLLRGAKCAVLVAPPNRFLDGTATDGKDNLTTRIDPARWRAALDNFTRTNAGRRTQVEVDDPEIGAQAQEHDYPLLGVAFDPHDRRIEIMLGRLGSGEPHLSRSIGDVESVDVLTDLEGEDVALRVRHGAGQTILSLAR